jgi:hypothetical protein
MENFNITRYKSASEISWLKNIHVALVDTYFQDITEYQDEVNYEIGDKVNNSLGDQVGEIIDILYNVEGESERVGIFAKIELLAPVNFDTLIQLGVPIENIVFDIRGWYTNSDLEYVPLEYNDIDIE